jgi:hypothetical protein
MNLNPRERRLVLMLIPAVALILILRFTVFSDSALSNSASRSAPGSSALLQARLIRLRQIAATAPAREAAMKQSTTDLAARERGIIQADTAAQAQAAVLEVARRIGKADQIDVSGGEFTAPRAYGDYGLVYVTINFECHVEQLVNFLADLGRQPELLAPSEQRITAARLKDKTMNVRMVLAGIVPKKLVPEKKGPGAL